MPALRETGGYGVIATVETAAGPLMVPYGGAAARRARGGFA